MKDSKLVWTSDPEAAKRIRESSANEPWRDEEPGKPMTVGTGFLLTETSLTRLDAEC